MDNYGAFQEDVPAAWVKRANAWASAQQRQTPPPSKDKETRVSSGLEGFATSATRVVPPCEEKRSEVREGFANENERRKWMIAAPMESTDMSFVPWDTTKNDWNRDKQTTFRADGTVKINQLQTDVLNLGNKWRFSGVGDAHANDNWLRVFDKDGSDYKGGMAMAQLWVRDNSYLNGSTVVTGPFDSQGNDARFRGGVSEHNPGRWQTHFPWPGDNKNYIRGDTEIRGNTNNIGDITVGRNANVTGTTTTNRLRANVINLGDKWRLSGVGDAHGNDGWLRMFDKNGGNYSGGIAMAQLWVRDNSYLNGRTVVTGPFESQANDAKFKGGASEHNPGGWQTHFPWPGDNRNYIRGDTEIRGNTNNIGDLTIGRRFCLGGTCITEGDLQRIKGFR